MILKPSFCFDFGVAFINFIILILLLCLWDFLAW
jgi:hypothetical protein